MILDMHEAAYGRQVRVFDGRAWYPVSVVASHPSSGQLQLEFENGSRQVLARENENREFRIQLLPDM